MHDIMGYNNISESDFCFFALGDLGLSVKGCDLGIGLLGRLSGKYVKHGAYAAVELMLFLLQSCGDGDPGAVFVGDGALALTDNTIELGIVGTAGHYHSAECECGCLQRLVAGNDTCHLQGLAYVLIHILRHISVPDGVVSVVDDYNGCVDVEG